MILSACFLFFTKRRFFPRSRGGVFNCAEAAGARIGSWAIRVSPAPALPFRRPERPALLHERRLEIAIASRALAQRIAAFVSPQLVLLSATTGLEPPTNKCMSQLLKEEIPALVVGSIPSPNITQDIMAHRPTGIVVTSESNADAADELGIRRPHNAGPPRGGNRSAERGAHRAAARYRHPMRH
jgi:hypothetical protein